MASHLCPLWELVKTIRASIDCQTQGFSEFIKSNSFLGIFLVNFENVNSVQMVASHLCPSWELVKTICTVSFAFLKLENGW